jgi:hypothetical protein
MEIAMKEIWKIVEIPMTDIKGVTWIFKVEIVRTCNKSNVSLKSVCYYTIHCILDCIDDIEENFKHYPFFTVHAAENQNVLKNVLNMIVRSCEDNPLQPIPGLPDGTFGKMISTEGNHLCIIVPTFFSEAGTVIFPKEYTQKIKKVVQEAILLMTIDPMGQYTTDLEH